MEATLIYNPNSGALIANPPAPGEIIDALRQSGYDPVHRLTEKETDLDQVLQDVNGLVVVAGGDGTLRAVSTRLAGKKVPIAPIPMGTANNICRALGVSGAPLEIAAGLANPIRQKFDLGKASFPWGTEYFLEALGFGFYADALAAYRPEEGKSLPRSLVTLIETLRNFEPHPSQMSLDGKDISGAYWMVEVLNTPAFGPRLKPIPDASMSDGLLEVLRVRGNNGADGLIRFVNALINTETEWIQGLEIDRGRRLEFGWEGWYPIHVDGEVRPAGFEMQLEQLAAGWADSQAMKASQAMISIEMDPSALEFWLPGLAGEAVTDPVPQNRLAEKPLGA